MELGVVSLSLQLLDTAQDLSKLIKSIKNAHGELTEIADSLDQLHTILKITHSFLHQQPQGEHLSESTKCVSTALKACERRMTSLQDLVDKTKTHDSGQSRSVRTWKSLKLAIKKGEFCEYQKQLRDAKFDLHHAISGNIWGLQSVQSHDVLNRSYL